MGDDGEWKSCNESFLFDLEDYEGKGPVKMPITSHTTDYAVLHDSNKGPLFGGGHDLGIASVNSDSSCNVGETYELPSQTDDPHFLIGSNDFTISEYKVFLV